MRQKVKSTGRRGCSFYPVVVVSLFGFLGQSAQAQTAIESALSEIQVSPIEAQRLQAVSLTRKLQADSALLESYQDYASKIEELAEKWPLLEGLIGTESDSDLALRKLLEDTYQQRSRRAAPRAETAARPTASGITRTQALPEVPPYVLTRNDIVVISCGTENTSKPRVLIRANARPADLVLIGDTFKERGQEFRLVAVHLLDDETLEAVFVHEGKELKFEDRITGFQGNNCTRKDA